MKKLGAKKKEGTVAGSGKTGGTGGDVPSNVASTGAGLTDSVDALIKLVQSICQNANPLGKSLEFINDDIESMNNELDYWQKQYKSSKDKMASELRITEDALQPMQDKLSEIEL
jgi:TRAF3-interacting protein 1